MWKGYISPVNFYAKYFNSSAYGTTFNCTSDVHTSYPPSFVGVFVVNQGSNSVTVKFLTLSTSGENATMHPDGSCTAAGVAVLVLQFEGVPHLPIEPSVGDTFVLTVYFTNGLKAALTYQFE